MGSSPRVWGQANKWSVRRTNRGIIPTRVGTRKTHCLKMVDLQDHPHACGDKKRAVNNRSFVLGSSPRVWGQESLHCPSDTLNRIIPTRVGTSHFPKFANPCLQDHPHACGDKLRFNKCVPVNNGIIPTRVGTSFCFCGGRVYS